MWCRFVKVPCLCLLLPLFVWLPATVTSSNVGGVQAHLGDVTFAGGMAYDEQSQILYLTGQVGPNGCFLGLFSSQANSWIGQQLHLLPEPASGAAVLPQPSGALVLASTKEGGLLTDQRPKGSPKATQYGLLLDLQLDASGKHSRLNSGSSVLFHEDAVQYPRAFVKDPIHSNYIYVASLHSMDPTESVVSREHPNQIDWTREQQYGSAYTMTIERLRYDSDSSSSSSRWVPSWRKPFGVLQNQQQGQVRSPSVHVSTMIWNKGALVVVGHTQGSGAAFGEADSNAGVVWNGFVTKLDPATGQFFNQGGTNAQSVQRIELQGDTFIYSICRSSDGDVLYISGSTTSNTNNNNNNTTQQQQVPFLAQLDAITLEINWQHIYEDATETAYGLACDVDNNRNVYMAGNIESNGHFDNTISYQDTDLFLLKLSFDGKELWRRQVGTKGNDRLAQGGGSGLLVTQDNGLFLLGDTTGNFMATSQKDAELFVLQIDFDGTLPVTTEQDPKVQRNGGNVQVTTVQTSANMVDDGDDDDDPSMPHITPPVVPDNYNNDSPPHSWVFVGFLGLLIALMCIGYGLKKSRESEKVTERQLVFQYLQNFDLEDVDVRHSATGGWHGTYCGPLAQGMTIMDGDYDNNRAQAHSSIVKDSLFVDYDLTTATASPSEDNAAPRYYDDDDYEDDDLHLEEEEEDNDGVVVTGRLSYKDQRQNLQTQSNPWGSEII